MMLERLRKFSTIVPTILFLCAALTAQSRPLPIQKLKRSVEKLGNLAFKSPLPVRYLSRDQLREYITAYFDSEYPDTLADKESLFLYCLGFVERNLDLKALRLRVLLNNIGGLYNEKTKELCVLEDHRFSDEMSSLIVVHELRHAVQDQHYNLSRILGGLSDFDDRKMAALAAVEGDATFVMVIHSGFEPEVLTSYNADALMSFSPLANTTALYNAPPVLRHLLTMPYIKGLDFITAVFKKKRWKGVARIFASPPQSSEQILHPEKYLKREAPAAVTLGYQPEGWTEVHSGVVGEFLIHLLLKGEVTEIDTPLGWGGDLFRLYTKPQGYFFIWESVWDKDKAAGAFFFTFKRFLEDRMTVELRPASKTGVPFLAGQSPLGFFFLRRFRDKVLFVRTNDRLAMNRFISGGYYD